MKKKWLRTGKAIKWGQWGMGENQSKGVEKDGRWQRGVRRKWVRQKQMMLGGLRQGDSWCLI